MFPDQQNQQGGQPQYGAAPVPPQPVQAPNGQYEVLPPLPGGQNNGHTGHNPYEFIMDPNAPHKQPLRLKGNFVMQIAMLVGGAVVLMIVIAVLVSAFAPKSSSADVIAVAQRQQEMIRIATAATTQATGQDTKNFVTTAQLSLTSDQQQIETYLSAHGTKLKDKTLALNQDAKTDTLLSNAANAGTYDATVTSTLSDQLQAYESLLQKAYKGTHSKTLRPVLQHSFTAASKLVDQAKGLQSAPE